MQALTLVGMLHVSILTMLLMALVADPTLLTCVTTSLLVVPLSACIGDVLSVLMLLEAGNVVLLVLLMFVFLTETIRDMA